MFSRAPEIASGIWMATNNSFDNWGLTHSIESFAWLMLRTIKCLDREGLDALESLFRLQSFESAISIVEIYVEKAKSENVNT